MQSVDLISILDRRQRNFHRIVLTACIAIGVNRNYTSTSQVVRTHTTLYLRTEFCAVLQHDSNHHQVAAAAAAVHGRQPGDANSDVISRRLSYHAFLDNVGHRWIFNDVSGTGNKPSTAPSGLGR